MFCPARRLFASLWVAAALAGCGNLSGTYPTHPLLQSGSVQIAPDMVYPIANLGKTGAVAAVAYYVVDPLAPNWEIKEIRLSQKEYQLSLRMKAFTTGGDGEARQLFQRRAAALARDGGFAGYQILSYTEGVESTTFPAAHQVSEGVVRLVSADTR